MNWYISAILAGTLLLAGCGGGGGSNTVNTTTGVSAVNAFPNLSFVAPVFLAGLPGTTQAVVVEQGGMIHRFDVDAQVMSTVVMLDISSQVLFSGEQGLLGLAFHPDFANNGFFYVHYSASNPRRSVLSRFTYNSQTGLASASSEFILLRLTQPFTNHNGGALAFGPDDKLYIALGDGGGGGDPDDNAQDRGNLYGTILRIDVDAGNPYGIPPDNPFVGEAGVREEIWAYGLRNPYRFSFDRQTGTLWAGDVGQDALEEIDIIQAGGNYGWRVFEGTQPFTSSQNTPPNAILIPPVIEYDHSLGTAVIGGYVYRGAATPTLWGTYVYGDFGSGRIWSLEYNGVQVVSNREIANVAGLTSFGEDNGGELYAVSGSGDIFRFSESN
jgi:glucose/arabinose dehydrogenase